MNNKPKPPPLIITKKSNSSNSNTRTPRTSLSHDSNTTREYQQQQQSTSLASYEPQPQPLFVRNNNNNNCSSTCSSPSQITTTTNIGGGSSGVPSPSKKNNTTAIHPFHQQQQHRTNRLSVNRNNLLPFHFSTKKEEEEMDHSLSSSCIKIFMSLRVKTMSVLFLTFLMIVALCLLGLVISFDVSFHSVEINEAIDSSRKTAKAIYDDFNYLTEKVYDFASWDDSYNIMKSENVSICDHMLDLFFTCTYMKRAGINFAIMYFPNGTYFNGRACFNSMKIPQLPDELKTLSTAFFQTDDSYGGRLSSSSAFQALLTPRKDLTQLFSNTLVPSSLFVNATNIILSAALPIQPNNNSDQNGVFLYGRYMTQSFTDDISTRTQHCTTFFDLSNGADLLDLSRDFEQEKNLLNIINNQSASKVSIKHQRWTYEQPFHYSYEMKYSACQKRSCAKTYKAERYSSRMATYQLYSDFNNSKSIVVRTDFNRDIYQVGWTSFMYTCFVLVAIVFSLLIVVMVFVECVVLRRILKIGATVKTITKTNDVSKRVPKHGFDELGRLCKDINHMLIALEESQIKLSKDNQIMQQLLEKTALEEQKSRCVMNSITDFIVTVECDTGILINTNTAFETKLLKKNSLSRSNSMSHLANSPQSTTPTTTTFVTIQSPNSPQQQQDSQPLIMRRPTITSPPTPTSKNIFENHNIMDYIKDFDSFEELRDLLESLSNANNGSFGGTFVNHHETVIQNDFSVKFHVTITVTKAKMTIREGVIGDAYIVLLRNTSEQKEMKNILSKQQEKLEEMRKISEFNRIFKDPRLRELFKEFSASELSAENVHFLEDIETYKSLSKTRDRAALLEEIISKYLTPESPYPLNVSKQTVETEIKKIMSGYGQLDLFDRIESIIKLMVVNDTFSRFLTSKMFRDGSATDLSRTSSSLTGGGGGNDFVISETNVSLEVL